MSKLDSIDIGLLKFTSRGKDGPGSEFYRLEFLPVSYSALDGGKFALPPRRALLGIDIGFPEKYTYVLRIKFLYMDFMWRKERT